MKVRMMMKTDTEREDPTIIIDGAKRMKQRAGHAVSELHRAYE